MPAEATPRAILRQLHAPDPVGRDIALLRTRLYRFSGGIRATTYSPKHSKSGSLPGHPPLPSTVARVRESLTAIRATGQPLSFSDEVAAAEDIDVTAELAARTSYAWQRVPQAAVPPAAVMIVGAPRSGTSHLFNLLAREGPFGYFTTASCWAWPVRNLHHPRRYPFTRASSEVLGVNNKRTRVIPGLVMPGEAEDISGAGALPAYRHIGSTGMRAPRPSPWSGGEILNAAASAHLDYFRRAVLLAKTPFNSVPDPAHRGIVGHHSEVSPYHPRCCTKPRTRCAVTASSSVSAGACWDAEEAWSMFVDAVRSNAPADRTITVTHSELLANPAPHACTHHRLELGLAEMT